MLRHFALFILITSFFAAGVTSAAPYRRLVNFEWEAIESAKSYEIELTQVKTEGQEAKTFSFKVKEAAWNGQLSPGKYMMKLRSHDYRGVPGEWSTPSEFNVELETVVLKSPGTKLRMNSNEDKEMSVDFQWNPVGGADQYHFELNSEDGKTKISENIKDTHFTTNIPVATQYTWKVSASNSENVQSEAVAVSQFTIIGKEVDSPKVQKPESEFVRELKWTHPEHVTGYDIYLLKFNTASKKWEKFQAYQDYKEDSLAFDPAWDGGLYQLVVRSNSDLRPHSKVTKETFNVRSGDRSPAAEYTALVRRSIEKLGGWYAIASYLITDMKFQGSNPEKNSSVAYDALGGTGRFGLGWSSPKTPWGFLGIIDLSGFTFKGTTRTFASAEMNAVYKRPVGDRGEVRYQVGGFYKELPETIGDPFTGASEDQMISSIGPHAGAEYWYSLTPKFGIQVNAHLYLSAIKVSTPNGQAISPTMSTQFGFMGSYRFSQSFTGLAGYARREDKMSYKAVPSSTNFATDGDVNESTIVGNYLNIYGEWSF
ncbi:MAG: hypothetical protein ACM3MG_02100 [Bacillota bacterium]